MSENIFRINSKYEILRGYYNKHRSFESRSEVFILRISMFLLNISTLLILFYALGEGVAAIFAAYFIFGLVGLMFVFRGGSDLVRIYLTIYSLSSIAAVLLAWSYTLSYGVPYCVGGSDELMYEASGLEFGKNHGIFDYENIRGKIVEESHNSVGYVYLVGLLVKFSSIFDEFHTMVPRLFNAMCLSATSVLIFLIGQRLGLKKITSVNAALFTGCLPLMQWVSVQTLRDVVQTLLLVLLVFCWLPNDQGKWRYASLNILIFSILLFIPMWELRKGQVFVGFLFTIFVFLGNFFSLNLWRLFLLMFPFLFLVLYFFSQYQDILFSDVNHFLDQIDSYNEYRSSSDVGGGVSQVIFNTPMFPFGWLYRISYALVSPLPVVFAPLYNLWLSFGTMIQIIFIPFLGMGLWRSITHSVWRYVALIFLLLFLGVAIFTFTVRQLIQSLPFGILLASFGFENYRRDPRYVYLIGLFGGVILGLLYMIIKVFSGY